MKLYLILLRAPRFYNNNRINHITITINDNTNDNNSKHVVCYMLL